MVLIHPVDSGAINKNASLIRLTFTFKPLIDNANAIKVPHTTLYFVPAHNFQQFLAISINMYFFYLKFKSKIFLSKFQNFVKTATGVVCPSLIFSKVLKQLRNVS
jgi:hypothetical protein